MEFVLGVISSFIASVIFFVASRISLKWPYPRGIRFIEPKRERYIQEIAELIRQNRTRLFFKGFTGFDLFSSEVIKRAFDETRSDTWQQRFFVFINPQSQAFSSEPNPDYTPERLHKLQETVLDFLRTSLFNNSHIATDNKSEGLYFVAEDKNFFNLLILDDVAFFFFRGFTKQKGPTGQVIVTIKLSKCPKLVKELVENIEKYYLFKCCNIDQNVHQSA